MDEHIFYLSYVYQYWKSKYHVLYFQLDKSGGFKAGVSYHLNLSLDISYYTIYAIRCFIMKPNAL